MYLCRCVQWNTDNEGTYTGFTGYTDTLIMGSPRALTHWKIGLNRWIWTWTIVSVSIDSVTHRATELVFFHFQCIRLISKVSVSISVYAVCVSVTVFRWARCQRISVIGEFSVTMSARSREFSVSDVDDQYANTGTSPVLFTSSMKLLSPYSSVIQRCSHKKLWKRSLISSHHGYHIWSYRLFLCWNSQKPINIEVFSTFHRRNTCPPTRKADTHMTC